MTDVVARTYGLEAGHPALKSVGAITFGPDAILFIADNVGASIFAVDLAEWCDATTVSEPLAVDNLDSRLAAHLGCPREDVHLRDLAVRPGSQQIVLSVMRGSGASAVPVLLTLTADGKLRELPLDNVRFAQTPIEDAPTDADER
jgi:hypothetical protein